MHKRHQHRYPSFAHVLEDFFNGQEMGTQAAGRFPAANIQETEENFLIELVIPGRKKEDIKIHNEKENLIVASDFTQNYEDANYQRCEYKLSPFKRSFRLPSNVDLESIAATYENGILSIKIAKKEATKVQREIQIS